MSVETPMLLSLSNERLPSPLPSSGSRPASHEGNAPVRFGDEPDTSPGTAGLGGVRVSDGVLVLDGLGCARLSFDDGCCCMWLCRRLRCDRGGGR
jgi:hypothetical protein